MLKAFIYHKKKNVDTKPVPCYTLPEGATVVETSFKEFRKNQEMGIRLPDFIDKNGVEVYVDGSEYQKDGECKFYLDSDYMNPYVEG